jgi:hypothetical protein
MKKAIRCAVVGAALAAVLVCLSASAEEPKLINRSALIQDARELASILEQSHPDPYINGGGKIAFHRRLQELLEAIPGQGMTVESFYRLLLPFVAALRDGHTAMLSPQADGAPRPGLPLAFKIIDESLAVADEVRKDGLDLRGARLEAVEGIPLAELVRRQNNLRGIENIYGTLALLTRSLATERGLRNLIPERTEAAKIRLTLRLAGGQIRDLAFSAGEALERAPHPSVSRVPGPDMSRSDVAWNFLDEEGKTAFLEIDDMSGYREACECWLAQGMGGAEDMARAAYRKFHDGDAPAKIEDVLAGIPSATEAFRDLVVAMKRAGTQNLIVDLRQNTGGNDIMVPMLLYFLFGREAMAASGQEGFQIAKYSDLYFRFYSNVSLADINRGRAQPLEAGDYDFADERARAGGRTPEALRREADEHLKEAPTFYAVFSQGPFEVHYRPPRLAVLSSAWTFSSGFTMLAALSEAGAVIVGTPSANAANNGGDSLIFELTNTRLRGAVSFKKIIGFPDDPEKGRCLRPDVELTYDKWASLGFDPNAEVLLAREVLSRKSGGDR